MRVKKIFFIALIFGCITNAFAADQQQLPAPAAVIAPNALLTGSEGDTGDPNNDGITSETTSSTTPISTTPNYTSVPPTPTLSPATPPPPLNTSAATTPANTSNELGSTNANRSAFVQMIRNLMPMDPQQITTLRNMFDRSQRAVAQYPGTPPKPTSSSILVNMSPGATPPVIRLRSGYVTSLVFLDSTGQPWPVTGYDLGNPKAFNIVPTAPDGKSDTLIIQAMDRYQEGNLAVMLKDENTPVMLTLMPGQHAVDYRVDLRMPGIGPNGEPSLRGLPPTEDPVLLDFLDGVAPMGAKMVRVEGAPAQAWVYQGHLFLRTRVTVLSPGWISSMRSPDGTIVYELTKTPVILASSRGSMLQLSIRGL